MWTVLSLAVGWCQNHLSASGFSRCAVDKPSMVYVSYKLLFHQSVWHTFVSKIYKNNFWQRISWLPQRWRTQRNAICSVNCRIQWIIESLNAHCALWYSGEHARFRIINILKDTVWTFGWRRSSFGCEPFCCKAMAWKWLCLQPTFLGSVLSSATDVSSFVTSWREAFPWAGWSYTQPTYTFNDPWIIVW